MFQYEIVVSFPVGIRRKGSRNQRQFDTSFLFGNEIKHNYDIIVDILCSHGQYKDNESKDSNAVLTLKGRQQARILAQKIIDTFKPTSLTVSDMTRAKQTMEILLEKLPKDIPLTTMKELREGRPCQPIPPSSSGLFQKSTVGFLQHNGE